jgi:hypothetical protein
MPRLFFDEPLSEALCEAVADIFLAPYTFDYWGNNDNDTGGTSCEGGDSG